MSSINVVNQKEYLKKYLGLGKAPGEKKKKKKKDKDSANRLKIIDDDIDDYNISKEIQMDIEAADEDAPQIVAVIDDRPPSLRVDEKTNTLLWKPLGEESDLKQKKMTSFQLKKLTLDNKSNVLLSKKISKDILKKKNEKSNSESHSKDGSPLYKDLETEIKKEVSYLPPGQEKEYQSLSMKDLSSSRTHDSPRRSRRRRSSSDNDLSPPNRRHSHDRDISPPRKYGKSPSRDNYVGEYSHSRKENRNLSPLSTIKQEPIDEDDKSLPRIQNSNERSQDFYNSRKIKQEHSDEDFSPPRKKQHNSPSISTRDISPPRKGRRYSNNSEDISPPRRKHKDSSSKDRDISIPKKRYDRNYKDRDEDISPPRKKDHLNRSNRDLSPKQERSRSGRHKRDKYVSARDDRAISPSRRKVVGEEHDLTPPRSVKDLSPPRKKNRENKSISPPSRIKRSISPDRKKRDRQTHSRWGDWSPDHEETDSSKKPEKTMSGKRAGLQNAKELNKEIVTLKEKEDRVFENMSEEISGRNAATVVRGQKTKDPEEEARKLKKEKEMKEKYDIWGKGLKQVESENQKMADQLYEMSKPLARYADDEDLEKYLKEQEREGDPMLAYIRKKKKKKRIDAGMPEKPTYMGEFMPNRYGIRPGYRWDGVDRSSGYEMKWYEQFNKKKAVQEEAFKWSTEDM